MEKLKQRAGDQPLPTVNDQPAVQDLVISDLHAAGYQASEETKARLALIAADVEDRKRLGIERYGTLLQAHNGRDSLRDAYDESLDLIIYLRQLIAEGKIRLTTLYLGAIEISIQLRVDMYDRDQR